MAATVPARLGVASAEIRSGLRIWLRVFSRHAIQQIMTASIHYTAILATDYLTVTIGAVADICGILNAPATISPYGTATPISNNPVFSTVALSESLFTVTSGTTPRSSTHEITGMSSSTSLSASLPSSSSSRATSTSTTTNIAQRHDQARSAVQGIAVALLGLALYL